MKFERMWLGEWLWDRCVRDEHHPRPLCIDGHAYHRRTRARRKRK